VAPERKESNIEMSAETRVVVIDDHAILRSGLRYVLEPHNIVVVADNKADESTRELIAAERPDVVVVDLRPEEVDAIDLIRDLSRKRNNVIAWGDYHDDRLVARAFTAGALGFAIKDDNTDALIEAIRTVAGGRRWLPTPMSDSEIDAMIASEQPQLSRREREILGLLSDGFSTDEVAEKLSLSAHTVRTHVKNAMRKLDASTRAHAVAIALRDLSIR
jgi:DNA-binding NarL/FixJ family response regulator